MGARALVLPGLLSATGLEAQQREIAAVLASKPAAVELRPYQRQMIHGGHVSHPGIFKSLEENRSTLLVAATGAGKTTVFGEVARLWKGRVLILVHRDELAQQAVARIEAMTGERVALEQAEFRAGRERIVVAMVQTLSRESRLTRFPPDTFGLIIIDEAHHAVANGYLAITNHFSGAKVLGVTATPDRGDRLALGEAFESVAYVYDILDAIEDKYLVPIVAQTVDLGVDFSRIKTTAGDLNQGQLDEAMGDEHVIEGVAFPTMELAKDRKTVIFTTSVANAHKMAAVINERRPDSARAVDGGMDRDTRRGIFSAYKRGDFQFLVNVMIATEGWDEPSVSCVAMGRPTKSRSLYAQCVGRGLRLAPGKSDCMVIDFTGNAGRHALVSPVDILAGRAREEEVTLAKELAGKKPGAKVHELLEMARDEIRARAERKVKYKVAAYDPFSVFHLRDNGSDNDWQFGKKDPTPGQIQTLEKFGIPHKGLSKSQASRLLDAAITRTKKGLASYKQLQVLQKYGIAQVNVSFSTASRLIDAIAQNKWRSLPADRVNAIMSRGGEAGERG